jgi:hypothetical protein
MVSSIRRCTNRIETESQAPGPDLHADRIDNRKFERAAFGGNEIPGRSFGQRFRFRVGEDVPIAVPPIRLVEGRDMRLLGIADRRKRCGQNHPLDAGFA